MTGSAARFPLCAVDPAADHRACADLPLNDIGNGLRFVAYVGGWWRRSERMGDYVFDGARWRPDDLAGLSKQLADQVVWEMARELKALRDDPEWPYGVIGEKERAQAREKRLGAHSKWVQSSGDQRRLSAMVERAAAYLQLPMSAWDANPDLLCLPNGTLDLSGDTPVLREHRREDFITHIAGIAYDPDARAPLWEDAIATYLPDPDVRACVQRTLGACLTDSVADQGIALFWGDGANGKSTIVDAVARVLGTYAVTAAPESFLTPTIQASGASHSTDLARLATRPRMVRVSEPEENASLSSARIKAITGGEAVTARELREKGFEFRPNFKIVLSLNKIPRIEGKDHGIWRRMKPMVAWQHQVPDDQIDVRFPERFRKEAAGILNWLIAGFYAWRSRGIDPPQACVRFRDSVRSDNDPVARFVSDCCERGDGWRTPAADLRAAYEAWAKSEGLDPLSAKRLSTDLSRLKIPIQRSNGVSYRLGVRLAQHFAKGDTSPIGPSDVGGRDDAGYDFGAEEEADDS